MELVYTDPKPIIIMVSVIRINAWESENDL